MPNDLYNRLVGTDVAPETAPATDPVALGITPPTNEQRMIDKEQAKRLLGINTDPGTGNIIQQPVSALEELLQRTDTKRANLINKAEEKARKFDHLETERRERYAATRPTPNRSVPEHINDVGSSTLKGLVNVAGTLGGVGNIATLGAAGEVFSKLDPENKAFSQRVQQTKEDIGGMFDSGPIKEMRERHQIKAQKRQEENEGKYKNEFVKFAANFVGALGEYVDEPSLGVDIALESIPEMLGPGALAKAGTTILGKNIQKEFIKRGSKNADKAFQKYMASPAGKEAIEKIQLRTGLSYIAASEGISNGLEVHAEILNLSETDLLNSSDEYNQLRASGLDHIRAREKLANKAAMYTTAMAGVLGAGASKIIGADILESKLFNHNTLVGVNITNKILRSTGIKGAAIEGAEETLQGASGKLSTNISKSLTSNDDQQLLEGVADNSAAGLVAGSMSGGVVTSAAENTRDIIDASVQTAEKVNERVQEAKAVFIREKEINEAVANNDISKFTNTDAPEYNPEDAYVAMTALGVTSEDPKDTTTYLNELGQHLHNMKRQVVADMTEALDNPKGTDQEQSNIITAINKRMDTLDEYREEFEGLKQAGELSPQKLREKLNELAQGKNKDTRDKAAAEILGSSQVTHNLSVSDTQTILKDQPDIDPVVREQLEAYVATHTELQELEQLTGSTDGSGGSKIGDSVKSYQSDLAIAVKAKSTKNINSILNDFKQLSTAVVDKAKGLQQLVKAIQENPDSKETGALKQHLKTTYKINTDGNIQAITKVAVKEARLVKTALKESISLVGSIVPTKQTKKEKPINSAVLSGDNTAQILTPTNEVPTPKKVDTTSFNEVQTTFLKTLVEANTARKMIQAIREVNAENSTDLSDKTIAALKNKLKQNGFVIEGEGSKSRLYKDGKLVLDVETTTDTASKEAQVTQPDATKKNLATNTNKTTEVVSETPQKPTEPMATKVAESPTLTNEQKFDAAIAILKEQGNLKKAYHNKTYKDLPRKHVKAIIQAAEAVVANHPHPQSQSQPQTHIPYEFGKHILKDRVTFQEKGEDTEKTIGDIITVNPAKGNILLQFDNFISRYKAGDTPINKAIEEQLPTDAEKTEFERFVRFEAAFRNAMLIGDKTNKASFTNSRDKNYRYSDDPFKLFLHEGVDGEAGMDANNIIDPNVVTILAATAYNWLATQATGTLEMPDSAIAFILGVQEDSPLVDRSRDLLIDKGTFENNLIDFIGGDALTNMGVRVSKKVDGTFRPRLITSVGNTIAGTLLQMGLIKENVLKVEELKSSISGFDHSIPWSGSQNFLRVVTTTEISVLGNEIERPIKALDNILKNKKPLTSMLNRLLQLNNTPDAPVFGVPPILNTVSGSNRLVPDNIRKVIGTHQNRPHKVKLSFYSLLKEFTLQQQAVLFGAQENVDETIHRFKRFGAVTRNNNILRTLEELHTFVDEMVGDEYKDGVQTPFYYQHRLWSNGRLGMLGGRLSIQNNKIALAAIGMAEHEVMIDPKDGLNNKTTQAFFRAIAQGLKRDTTKPIHEIIADMQGYMKTPVVGEALNILGEYIATGHLNADRLMIILKDIPGKESKLPSLLALAEYTNAVAHDSPFYSTLALEVDGITNGTIIGTLLSTPINDEKWLRRLLNKGGVFFDDTYTSYSEYINDARTSDIYQTLAILWDKALRKINNTSNQNTTDAITGFSGLIGDLSALIEGNITSASTEGRDLSKGMVIRSNFGAGQKATTQKLFSDVIDTIYDKLALAHSLGPEEGVPVIQNINDNLNRVLKHMKGGTPINFTYNTALEAALTERQYKELYRIFSDVYGEALEVALDTMFSDVTETRDKLTEAIDLGASLFLKVLQDQMAIVGERNGGVISEAELNDLMSDFQYMYPAIRLPNTINEDMTGLDTLKKTFKRVYEGENDSESYKVSTRIYSKTDKNKAIRGTTGKKSLTNYGRKVDYIANALGTIVNMTISTDGAIMLDTLSKHGVVNIHDAMLVGLDKQAEATGHINKSTLTMTSKYTPVEEVVKMLEKVRKGYVDYFKDVESTDKDRERVDGVIKALKTRLDETKKRKEKLFSDVAYVNQYDNGEVGYAVKNKYSSEKSEDVVLNELFTQFSEEVKEYFGVNEIEEDSFGSGNTGDIDLTQSDEIIDVTSLNTLAVYDMLGSMGGKTEHITHRQHLRGVLTNLINQVIEPVKLHITKTGKETQGLLHGRNIYMVLGSQANPGKIRMSAQEVYVHELIHAITKIGIDTNSTLRAKLKKLFAEVEAHTTWENFLSSPSDVNNPVEVARAKERYDYIFNNRQAAAYSEIDPLTKEKIQLNRNNYLHEFVAHALTNEAFIRHLSTIHSNTKKVKTESKSFLDRLLALFENIMTTLNNIFHRSTSSNMYGEINQLVEQLVYIDKRHKNYIQQKIDDINIFNFPASRLIVDYVVGPLTEFTKSSLIKKTGIRSIQALGKLLPKLPTADFVKWLGVVKAVRRRHGKLSHGLIDSLLVEIIGRTTDNNTWHVLSNVSNKLIDQLRGAVTTQVKNQILDNFGPVGVSSTESLAITKTLIKTDLPLLMDQYTPEQLMRLLTSEKFLNTEIAKRIKELEQFSSNKHFYRKMAYSLAHYMVHGNIVEHNTFLNAYAIANLHGTDVAVIGDVAVAEKVIDELTTLYALELSDNINKNNLHTVMKREYERDPLDNGITFAMQVLRMNKQTSLDDLFSGDKALMVKGYTKEIYDPNVRYIIGYADEEAEFKKAGYLPHHKINKDKLDPYAKEIGVMYVNTNASMDAWLSGITSITGENRKGTNLHNSFKGSFDESSYAGSKLDVGTLNKNKAQKLKAIFSPQVTRVSDETLLVPVGNTQGKIVDYRYVMSEGSKDTILNKNNNFSDIIGAMEGSIKDKVNSRYINNLVVETAHEEFKKDFKNNAEEFVLIGLSSKEPEFKERYYMLPTAMRQHIKTVWGQDGMYVRREMVDLIFGFRKLGIQALIDKVDKLKDSQYALLNFLGEYVVKFLSLQKVRMGAHIWTDIVKIVKDTIVIKIGEVLFGNILSNTIVLLTEGIPIKDIVTNHIKAIKYSREYQNTMVEIASLQRDLSLKNKYKQGNPHYDAAAKARLEVRIARLKDDIRVNPVRELMDAGIYHTIIEDLDAVENDAYSYPGKLKKWVEPATNYVPEFVKVVGKNIFFTHDTKIYQLLRNITQLSDFVARYVLYEHNVKNMKMSKEDALKDVEDRFIKYELPTHPGIQAANDNGLFMFTKYMFRIQKTLLQTVKQHPGKVAALVALQAMFGDVPDVFDANLITGPIAGRVNLDPLDFISQALDTPGTQLLKGIF